MNPLTVIYAFVLYGVLVLGDSALLQYLITSRVFNEMLKFVIARRQVVFGLVVMFLQVLDHDVYVIFVNTPEVVQFLT
jgi:hypothetical protein